MLICSICFSLSDLRHFVWQAWGSSTLLELTQTRSFSWLSNIPLCVCVWHCALWKPLPLEGIPFSHPLTSSEQVPLIIQASSETPSCPPASLSSVPSLGPQPPVNTLWAHLYIVSLPILVHVTHWPASSWRAKNAPISASMGSPWFPHSRAQEMLAEWIMKGKRFECEDAYPLFR